CRFPCDGSHRRDHCTQWCPVVSVSGRCHFIPIYARLAFASPRTAIARPSTLVETAGQTLLAPFLVDERRLPALLAEVPDLPERREACGRVLAFSAHIL